MAPCVLFPGQRLRLAFTLATGLARTGVQQRIDALEDQAIHGAHFSSDDKQFLNDFYRTLATGAKLSILVRQTGALMDHYLDGSGTPYRLEPAIFRDNKKVQAQLEKLRARVRNKACKTLVAVASPPFYMPDRSKIDSVFGLYHGQVALTWSEAESGRCVARVRAEVPWFWPTYESLAEKYGDPHGESFPLPNLLSLLFGRQHALFVDNGLGEALVGLGLARPFVAFAEWEEPRIELGPRP